MQHIVSVIRKTVVTTLALALVSIFPLSISAPIVAADTPCSPPPATTPGVHWPTGSDAVAFTYQCDGPYSGMWVSQYYIFDPATLKTTPITQPTYTYNTTTGKWDATVMQYDPPSGAYLPIHVAVANPPAGAPTVGGPVVVTSDPAAPPTSGDEDGSDSASTLTAPASCPGGSGTSGVSLNGNTDTTINNNTGASMTNTILSGATSGNAGVTGNTSGGSAATGQAQVIANVINMLQSSSNILGDPNTVTFTANINGDVNGDLLLDPAQLSAIQPANDTTNVNNNVTVNNSVDASIANNIDLNAKSGNATVANNTSAGNATSGNAQAVANIVNVLNSAINAGKSFVGVININGNLNGDILLPPSFIDTLLASNVPRYTVNTNVTNTTTVANVNNATITNHIDADATTGNAIVSNNTGAGSATSGNATTNLTVFNLTGSQVVASNDLLVFVNVTGHWYGMILNAPAGTTAASLGGGVASNTNITNNETLNNTNDQSITNNIHTSAQSGDATVRSNTQAGDATTGDAKSSVNLMNMINDSLSLNGWFGLLFINVFGTWNGSFGINTSAGDPTPTPASAGGPAPTFRFAPHTPAANTYQQTTYTGTTGGANGDAPTTKGNDAVLAAKIIKTAAAADTPTLATGHSSYLLPLLGGSLALIILLAGERQRFTHKG